MHKAQSASSEQQYGGLRLPQVRVLKALIEVGGLPISRGRITELVGNKTQVVAGRAIGYSDPAKRLAFEQTKDGGGSPGNPCLSLLTLGYVEEVTLFTDSGDETGVQITLAGRRAFADLGFLELPPLRD